MNIFRRIKKTLFACICTVSLSGGWALADCVSDAKRLIFEGSYSSAVELVSQCNDPSFTTQQRAELLSLAEFHRGRYSDALRFAEQVPDSLAGESLLVLKGRIKYQTGRYNDAADIYRRLTEVDSCNASYFRQLAASAYRSGDPGTALVPSLRALELSMPDVNSSILAATILDAVELGKEADSIAALALEFDSIPALLKLRGDISYRLKEYETAYDCYRVYMETNKGEQSVVRKAGVSLYMIGEPEEAISMLSLAYEMDPTDEVCCYYLGSAYQTQREYGKAELFYTAAVNNGFSENLSLYYHRLGVNYEQTGDYQESLESFRKAYAFRKDNDKSQDKILLEMARIQEVYLDDKAGALENFRRYVTAAEDTTTRDYRYASRKVRSLEKDSLTRTNEQ